MVAVHAREPDESRAAEEEHALLSVPCREGLLLAAGAESDVVGSALHVLRDGAARGVEVAGPEEVLADERHSKEHRRRARPDPKPRVPLQQRACAGVHEHPANRVDAVRVDAQQDALTLDAVQLVAAKDVCVEVSERRARHERVGEAPPFAAQAVLRAGEDVERIEEQASPEECAWERDVRYGNENVAVHKQCAREPPEDGQKVERGRLRRGLESWHHCADLSPRGC